MYEAYVEFWIPLTLLKKAILEAKLVVKRETKGRRIIKRER